MQMTSAGGLFVWFPVTYPFPTMDYKFLVISDSNVYSLFWAVGGSVRYVWGAVPQAGQRSCWTHKGPAAEPDGSDTAGSSRYQQEVRINLHHNATSIRNRVV